MNAYKETLRGVQWVLDNCTSYQVAKDLNINARTVNRYQNGETPVGNMKAETMGLIYNYYLDKFGHIFKFIEGIEKGTVELTNDDPDFYEKEYADGPSSEFIIHTVEGHEELEVFFAERDFVQEIKQKIYVGDTDDLDHEEMELNEYADRFNYDDVVAYRVDDGEINWI